MEQRAHSNVAVFRAPEALRFRKLQARYLGITMDELDAMLERQGATKSAALGPTPAARNPLL